MNGYLCIFSTILVLSHVCPTIFEHILCKAEVLWPQVKNIGTVLQICDLYGIHRRSGELECLKIPKDLEAVCAANKMADGA